MDEKIFNLLVKKISNELSNDEAKFIDNLIQEDKQISKEYSALKEVWNKSEELKYDYLQDDSYKKTAEKIISLRKKQRLNLIKRNLQYAAAVAIIFVSLLFALTHKKTIRIVNNSDKVEIIKLPDNSQITLQKGAIVEYKSSILQKFNRQIYFQGKAFFDIAHNPDKKFIVKTSNFDVTVFGTKFNISAEDITKSIVLVEGKVTVDNFTSDKNRLIEMKPNQMVEYNTKNGEITLKNVNTQVYTFWTNEKFDFDNFSINEIIDIFKIYYGKIVVFDDTTLKHKQIGGSAPTDDLSLIIDALAFITNTKPIFEKDTIYFK